MQRKHVRILAITFAVGIELTTLGSTLYHYTRWPRHYGLVKMCLCHIRKTRSVIVPWTHIQPCPGHIYNPVLDTYIIVPLTRSISVSLTHLNMCLYPIFIWQKDKNIDIFQALTKFSNHSAEETCEDPGNYICSGNWTQNLGVYTVSLYHMAKRTLFVNTCYLWYIIAVLLV